MRIGIRVPARTSGGGRTYYENLQAALRRSPRCDEVVIFRMGDSPSTERAEVVVHTPDGPLGRRLLAPRRLADAIQHHPVDVLLSAGTEVSRVPGVPGVFWPLTVAPFEEEARLQLGDTTSARLRWWALRAALSSACAAADAFVFSSYYAQGLFSQRAPVVRDRPTVVLPPAPTAKLPEPTAEPTSAPYLLFVSHVYPYKMLVEVIEAHAEAMAQGVDLDLVVAGGLVHSGYAQRVRAAIERQGTGDRVHLLGEVNGLALGELYRGAWAFVFPSVSENAGSYALIDAFTAGVPVLSSGLSSLPEACQDAARYFDPRVPASLTSELVALYSAPEVYADLAARSARRGTSVPTWDWIAESFIDFVSTEVLNRRPTG